MKERYLTTEYPNIFFLCHLNQSCSIAAHRNLPLNYLCMASKGHQKKAPSYAPNKHTHIFRR